MEERVRVRERGAPDGCPFCRDLLREADEVLRCGTCETRLHAACFRESGLACTVLGCGGRAVVPAALTPRPGAGASRAPAARRESKRERKRQLRERQRAERRVEARQHAARAPRASVAPAVPRGEASWSQGPIGLAAALSLLFVVPPLVYELGGPTGEALAILAVCGGLGWAIRLAKDARR